MSIRLQGGERLELVCAAAPWRDGVEFLLKKRTHDGHVYAYDGEKMDSWSELPVLAPIEPTFGLRREEAQVLMDQLWEAGIRPAGAAGSMGQLAATEAHLKDLRRYADRMLEVVVRAATPPPFDAVRLAQGEQPLTTWEKLPGAERGPR